MASLAGVSSCPFDTTYGEVRVALNPSEGPLHLSVETKRLLIVSINNEEYEKDLVELYGDKQVNESVGYGTTAEPEAVHLKIQRWMKKWSEGNPLSGYLVLEKETKAFVGQVIVKRVKDRSTERSSIVPGKIEIGYLSSKAYWGRGYGNEYVHAVIYHLIPALIKSGFKTGEKLIDSVMATARPDNPGSTKILAKFLTYEKTGPLYGGTRHFYLLRYTP